MGYQPFLNPRSPNLLFLMILACSSQIYKNNYANFSFDQVMRSSQKIANFGPPRNQRVFTSIESFWRELSKNAISIESKQLTQTLWNFGSFSMITPQLWLDYVAAFETSAKIFPNSHSTLNFRGKLAKIGAATKFCYKVMKESFLGGRPLPLPPPC